MNTENTKWTPGPWYSARNGNAAQGLVISEETGANVAVTYDPKDAALIAAAPELAELLKQAHVYVAGEAPGYELDKAIRAILARLHGEGGGV